MKPAARKKYLADRAAKLERVRDKADAALKKIRAEQAKEAAKPRTSPVKTHEVVLQTWEVADSWSGPEDTVPTIHLTEEDRDLYVKGFYRTNNNLPSAPEVYTRTKSDPKKVNVTDEWHNKLLAQRRSKTTDYTKYGIEAAGLMSYLG